MGNLVQLVILSLFLYLAPCHAVNAPSGITVDNIKSTEFTVLWTTPSDAISKMTVDIAGTASNENNAVDVVSPHKVINTTAGAAIVGNTEYTITVYAVNSTNATDFNSTTQQTTTIPDQVTGVGNSSSATVNSIFLAWNAVSGTVIVTYTVSWSPSASGKSEKTGITDTKYTIPDLTASTQYRCQVTAVNSAGSGQISASETFTTLPNAPGKPLLTKPATPTTQITVSWSAPTGGNEVVDYVVEWTPNDDSVIVPYPTTTTTIGQTKSLVPGQQYSVTVKARNSAGAGAKSPASTHRTDPTPPSSLSFVSLTNDNNITLTLVGPASPTIFTGYNLNYTESGKSMFKQINENTSPVNTTISNLVPNIQYTFSVTVYSGSSSSSQTNSTPADPIFRTTYPGTPTDVAITTVSTTEVNVTFTQPKNGANIYIATLTGVTINEQRNGSNSSSPVQVGGLSPGHTYSAVVSASASATILVEGVASSAIIHTIKPEPVTNFRSTEQTSYSIYMSWDLPTLGIFQSQNVTYVPSDSSENAIVVSLGNETNSYNITGLTSGVKYTISVITISNNIESDPATDESMTVTLGVSNLLAANQTTRSIFVTWQAPPAEVKFTKYSLEYSVWDLLMMSENITRVSVHKSDTSYNITGLEPGTLYTVTVSTVSGTTRGQPRENQFPTEPNSVLSVMLSSVSITEISVQWTRNSGGVSGYEVIATNSNGVVEANNTIAGNTTLTTKLSGLTPGTVFNVQVKALFSALKSFPVYQSAPTYPAEVSGLAIPSVFPGTLVQISWQPPTRGAADSYNVSINSNGTVTTTHVNVTNFTTTLVHGRRYIVTVYSIFSGLLSSGITSTTTIRKYTLDHLVSFCGALFQLVTLMI